MADTDILGLALKVTVDGNAVIEGQDSEANGGASFRHTLSQILARAVHTGTQPLSTISDAGNAAGKNVGAGANDVAAGDHDHASVYEPANANIQSHIGSIANPHGTTKTQVGLANVTNDAQVKKAVSSTDNALPRWDGIAGDAVQDSKVSIDDNGAIYGHRAKIKILTGTTHTITEADNGQVLAFTNASDITVTLPQTNIEDIPGGFQAILIQRGAGRVGVVKQGSDTIESKDVNTKTSGQHASATLIKWTAGSPNVWGLYGDLAP